MEFRVFRLQTLKPPFIFRKKLKGTTFYLFFKVVEYLFPTFFFNYFLGIWKVLEVNCAWIMEWKILEFDSVSKKLNKLLLNAH